MNNSIVNNNVVRERHVERVVVSVRAERAEAIEL
jgi:hypothetical protein